MNKMVETARGPVATSDLGATLCHEHLLINMMTERRGDGLINDENLVCEEVSAFARQGGATIVDLSSSPLTIGTTTRPQPPGAFGSRTPDNVEALARISERSGVHVILSTGHYRDPYLANEEFDNSSKEELAEGMIRDLTVCIPGTSARAAVIGEIGSDRWFISPREEKSFRASALASAATGAPIYTHAARWAVGMQQVDLLLSEGAQADRIAVGHVDTVPDINYALELAHLGVYLGIDTMYQASEAAVNWRVKLLNDLCEAGFSHRVLLSQDVCVGSQLKANGGPGFTHILGSFRAACKTSGVSPEIFDQIVTTNPQRFLARSM